MMPKYAVHLTQALGGCDYTIGCGSRLVPLQATSQDKAISEAKDLIIGEDESDGYHDESKLKKATLVTIETSLPLEDWYREYNLEIERQKREAAEQAERAQLEILRKKYP